MTRARRLLAGLAALVAVAVPASATAAHAALTPSIAEHALPPGGSNPFGVTTGPDGALWFTQWVGNGLGRMTTAGAVTTYTTSASATAVPWAVTTGADGNLWVAEPGTSVIARVTPAGAATEFPVPTASSAPNAITLGPDGDVWFTETNAGQVGHVSPEGEMVELALPSPDSAPSGIATGADGNLWVTEPGIDAIARVTPTGTITEFPIPTPDAYALDIVAGPDGNLWFVERNAGMVAKLTTTGAITEYPLPTAGAQPLSIVAGPDGALWFAELAANAIGRITTDGAVEEYPLPTTNAQPGGITVGPDGNVWATETELGALARVTTPPAIGAVQLSSIARTSVNVSAAIGAHAQGTRAHVEFGPTTSYGSSTTDQAFSTGSPMPVGLTWSVTGLRAGTVHLRVVATNATGTTYGPDQSFTTEGAAATPDPPAAAQPDPPATVPPVVAPPAAFTPLVDLAMVPNPVLEKVMAKRRPSTAATLLGPSVVRVTNGHVPLTLGCPETATGGCTGSVAMRTTAPPPKGKKAMAARCARGCRPLGKVKFQAKAGKKRRVSVNLSKAGRGKLAHSASLKALVTVTTVVAGQSTTSRRTITLRTNG